MLLQPQVHLLVLAGAARAGLVRRLDWRDERGEITSTTITIAVLATLALAVGAIIVAKVTAKANSIPVD